MAHVLVLAGFTVGAVVTYALAVAALRLACGGPVGTDVPRARARDACRSDVDG